MVVLGAGSISRYFMCNQINKASFKAFSCIVNINASWYLTLNIIHTPKGEIEAVYRGPLCVDISRLWLAFIVLIL